MKPAHTLFSLAVARVCVLALAVAAAPALAIPDAQGQVAAPDASAPQGEMAARLNYNIGFETFEKARAAEQALGAKPRAAALAAVMQQYREARGNFETAVKADPNLKEGWNLIGYTSRRLGEYDRSLEAYEKALALNPQYTEAIEYRAEAYLALGRLDDVKGAYLALFGASRVHAAVLMESMQKFVTEKRKAPGKLAAGDLDAFSQWVTERAALAQQTAALAPDQQPVRDWR
jgi:tetratricopeptide (TPR) repeat protein